MSENLLILIENEGAAAIAESALSWPKRVLGAGVLLFNWNDESSFNVNKFVQTHSVGTVVYCSTLSENRAPLQAFKRFRQDGVQRIVLWCSEASAPSYQKLLIEYRENECFDLMLGTGCGKKDAPYVDETFLWPCDPHWYAESMHEKKWMRCGFGGAVSEARLRLMDALGGRLAARPRDFHNDPYRLYAKFLADCKSTVNDARLDGILAVKNRCVEAGLAGCLLFENRGSPLRDWFTPDVDYVEYERPEEILDRLKAPNFEMLAQSYGERLRAKVPGPEEFWKRVMGG